MFSPVGKIGLAPMAGPGDSGFRRICREYGADYTVSEMISAKAIRYGSEKSFMLANFHPDEAPIIIQLFGHEPDSIEYAASFLASRFKPSGIDLNMGCPAPKIFSNGDGSALLKNSSLACDLVKAARFGSNLPVSVKLRIGIDAPDESIIEFAHALELSGASFLTVHGRTREQFYSGNASYSLIKRIKEALSIPVIANGDIVDGISARAVLEETGADGIALARGALGAPFVFDSIKRFLSGEEPILFSLNERFDICLKHLQYTIDDKGEEKACIEFRKHLLWYLKGIGNASCYKVDASRITKYSDVVSLLANVIEEKK